MGTLVRHADDLVVMCWTKARCEEVEQRVRSILGRLGLELHPEKTRRVDLSWGQHGFDFLGCELRKVMSGKIWEEQRRRVYFLHRRPSRRSMQRIRDNIRVKTHRGRCHADLCDVIGDLNPILRGWGNYFRTGNAARSFHQIDTFVWQRLRGLRIKRKGRQLHAGEFGRWTRDFFHAVGLHRLRGTVRYPGGCVKSRRETSSVSGVREKPHARFEREPCQHPSFDGERLDLPMSDSSNVCSDGRILDDSDLNGSEFEHSFLDDSFIGIQASQLEDFEPPPVRSRAQNAAKTLGNVDPFANINACTSEQIERLARILEIRGAQPRQVKMRAACFRAAGLSRGMSVLELGCGTGVVTRELAQFAGGSGRVVGLDVSLQLLDMARRTRPPEDTTIEYVHGNACKLEFPSNSFDASCAITLLAHIEDLDKVVKEMIRVTRRTVMLLDQDYQTLVFENSNTRLTRAILQCGADYNVLDGWCGRKLAGLLVRHRLRDVHCWPFVYSERESQSYLITIAERFAALAASRGIVTEEEARIWLQELYDRAIEGTFYASLNYYFSFGTKAVAKTS